MNIGEFVEAGLDHAQFGDTCGSCSEAWPCTVARLLADNARLTAARGERTSAEEFFKDLAVKAEAGLDRLQATATRRGELLARVLGAESRHALEVVRAAIVAELADGEDGP